MKCIRAALNRHFKATRGLDIISDSRFIGANEMFRRMTRKDKKEGRGETQSMPTIEPKDFTKLSNYFKTKIAGPPNPAVLQNIVVFYIENNSKLF